jgi:hypothetical protein
MAITLMTPSILKKVGTNFAYMQRLLGIVCLQTEATESSFLILRLGYP